MTRTPTCSPSTRSCPPTQCSAPLVAESPWRRVPGHVDGFELAVRAILGQQVSVAAARTNAARLVARYGEPLASPSGSLTHLWPAPAALRDADVPAALARRSDPRACRCGPRSPYGADPARVLELPGVGPWTASYVAMRALGDRDAFHADRPGRPPRLRGARPAGRSASASATPSAGARSAPTPQHLWAVGPMTTDDHQLPDRPADADRARRRAGPALLRRARPV